MIEPLQSLIEVHKNGSFSKAAESLGVTQSAISQSIKNLETSLGFTLVERQGKHVFLTPDGETLVKFGKEYRRKYEDTINHILEQKNKVQGQIHLGTMTGVGKTWVAKTVLEFAREYPSLSVKLTLDTMENLVEAFNIGEIDCLIGINKGLPSSAGKIELHAETSTLVYPQNWSLNPQMEVRELLKLPLIFFEDNDPLFIRWVKEMFHFHPRVLQPRLVINSFGHILKAVSEGLGVAVIPTHVFKRSFHRPLVSTFGKEFDMVNERFYFVHHPHSLAEQKMRSLFDKLHQVAQTYHQE